MSKDCDHKFVLLNDLTYICEKCHKVTDKPEKYCNNHIFRIMDDVYTYICNKCSKITDKPKKYCNNHDYQLLDAAWGYQCTKCLHTK